MRRLAILTYLPHLLIEIIGRQRWVRYAQEAPLENASQVPSEWHAWLHHTRLNAPHEDEVVKKITAQTQHWRPVSLAYRIE